MSRSSIVKTVSRCMCARSLPMTAAITRSAAPFANKRFRDLLDHAALRALAHTDQHRPIADRLDIAAFERRPAEIGRHRTGPRRPAPGTTS